MGCDVRDLAGVLSVSRRTLFACRADDRNVTRKTLLRLEAAEREAGLGAAPAQGARAGSGEGGPLASLSPDVLPAVEALREIFSAQLAEQLAEQTSRLESRLAALERLLAKQKMRPR